MWPREPNLTQARAVSSSPSLHVYLGRYAERRFNVRYGSKADIRTASGAPDQPMSAIGHKRTFQLLVLRAAKAPRTPQSDPAKLLHDCESEPRLQSSRRGNAELVQSLAARAGHQRSESQRLPVPAHLGNDELFVVLEIASGDHWTTINHRDRVLSQIVV